MTMTRVLDEDEDPVTTEIISRQAENVFYSNVRWLLDSGIRIKNGKDTGALYGWKYLDPPSYPFVYSEVTGYAISCFSWIYSELGQIEALESAKQAAEWTIRNMDSEYLLVAGYRYLKTFVQKGDLSNQIYLFDNGMAMIGLLNLYRLTRKMNLLTSACNMADTLIKHFFKDSTITVALVDKFCRPTTLPENKWSTIPGSYHSKLSLGFLLLSRLTGDPGYAKISDNLCKFAVSLQNPDGRFVTTPDSQVTYLHAQMYACEGLVYSGIIQSNSQFLQSGLKGIVWATRQLNPDCGLTRDSSKGSVEQSDATAQLLRLLVLCHSDLQTFLDESSLGRIIDNLHERLLSFCILSDSDDNEDNGGVKYQLSLKSVCSWCTMFCMQAIRLRWKKNNNQLTKETRWIDYFV